MAGFKIEGSTSGNVAEVDANNNLKVNTPTTETQAGFVTLASEIDAGTVTGARLTKALEVSENFRLRVGQDQLIFNDTFGASAYNINNWTTATSTQTVVASNGWVTTNNGGSTASGAYSIFRTWRHFPIFKQYTSQLEMNVLFTASPQTNNECIWGLASVSTTAAPTDGAFFRLDTSGLFKCVVVNNSVETASSALNFNTLVGTNTTKQFLIYMDSNSAKFWINNILVATLSIGTAANQLMSAMTSPICFRNYNNGVPAAAQKMQIGQVSYTLGDLGSVKMWADVNAGMGNMALQLPNAAGGQTSNYTNSLAAGAGAALTNTTSAAGTGLGGQFAVQPTLAAGTDGILASYLVTSGSTYVPGKTLYITGIRIQGAVTTALTGGPVIYAYAVGIGSSALSLATTDSATAKAPRRMPLGFETYAAAAAAGTIGQGVTMTFNSPLCVYQGEYLHIIAKNLGTVTSAGVITVLVAIDGYWE